jgi:hypothetical protein
VTPGTCPGYTSPFEPYHSALTARISKVSPSGHRTTVAGGLPSARDRFGDVLGAADVVVHGRTVYALVAGGGCSRGPEDTPSGIWRLDRDRSWSVVADFSRYLADNPTAAPPDDDFEPDGAVYNMVGAGRTLYVVEANHGEIERVDPGSGPIRRVLDISARRPHITPTAMTRRGGHLYVGNLGSFPIQRGASIIFRVDRHGRHQRVVATGLSFPTGIAAGPDGDLYVSEHGYGGDPTAGRILRVRLR